ncbi:Gfo/Idh/MocA family protein [Draconibacterium halophilum]|uniref:Gfo/Idh/MocA family oxidoreductase n=1 Tax=Draconibacterium halophilum TaxID=2706887 RepID=A0A6C0RDA7_9BACT|nr:Gfo/Idh/MocA family oxidoreductase [Draconibacterium halophilum]QIA08119.1 Gfo/Idh/MocA family oxidoreductase [Draconibacterium halophilum]
MNTKSKQKSINWGIIGVGNVTEVKSGPAFYKVENSKLVAVMRRNEEKAQDYARRHNVPKWYSNGSALINDPEVNAVYIATPPDTHALYAIEALKAGKPVYVEKPMARNYAECLEMLKVSEETNTPLWVAYYRRTLPAFLRVKELIETGSIGKPLMVNIKLYKQAAEANQKPEEMRWHVFPEIAGGGYFFDLASHQLDYLDFVFGKISGVKGQAVNQAGLYPAEDTVTGTWKHESGVVGTGSWCFVVDEKSVEDYIQIVGEKGEICLPCFTHGDVIVKNQKGTEKLSFNNPQHISQNLVKQVVNELLENGKCVSTGESAARTSLVLDEMVKDYYIKNQ